MTKKPTHAEAYFTQMAVRNRLIEILEREFPKGKPQPILGRIADEILAIDPKAEVARFMSGSNT